MNNEQLISKVKEMIQQINQECFAGALLLNFPVQIVNTSRMCAYVSFRAFGGIFGEEKQYHVKFLGISKNFVWNEEELKSTLVHELIHVYEAQVLKTKPSHGVRFKLKMAEINQKFPSLNVTLKTKMKSTKERKNKNVSYMLSEDKTKIAFMTDSLLNRVLNNQEVYQKYFGNFTVGKINTSKISKYKLSRISRKFKYYQLSLEEMNSLLSN